jgi:tetratricopeptide (TPR) repeat protein
MTLRSTRNGQAALVVLLAAFLLTPNSFAQYQQGTPPATPGSQSGAASQAQQQTQKETQPAAAAAAPKADPEEEAAYKAFSDTKPEDADKRIQLGEKYVEKYPSGKYDAQVYQGLTTAEYSKQDLPKMYADADKTLALNPDDVTVLVLVGWVIPHNYDPNDLAAESRLDKGEKYEKHALEVLATLPKPANMTDEQFAKVKAQGESQAHSGLGLIYFRRQDYEQSIAELKKSTADPANQDATDYYVMGVELTRLKRFSESADAFQKCSTMPGGLQDRCKQMGTDAKKQAAATPAPPK